MKRSELIFNLISILVDWLMLIAAGVTAFFLRFELAEIRPILYSLTAYEYIRTLIFISPGIILLLALAGLYNLKGTRRFSSEFIRIFLATSSGLLLIVIMYFFNQQAFSSRLIVLFTWLITLVFITIGRVVLRRIQVMMLKKGVGLHRLVVIESGIPTYGLVRKIEKRPELAFKIIAKLPPDMSSDEMLKKLEEIRIQYGVDELLQANPNLSDDKNVKLIQFCRDYGIKFNFVPNLFETEITNIEVETISGIPIIVLKGTPLDGWGRVVKRFIDIVVSFIALIILSPILLLVAIAIKLNSKGPVFFHQPRAAGLGQFECYKFRSMYYEMSEGTVSGDKLREQLEKQNARVGPYVKIKNDPRVTAVGRFIRKTKLDEMPQLWHILRGQMSLVGPRVHMVKEVDHFRNDFKRLFILKPGATGLTQITQATEKPEISWEEEIKLDEFYIQNWSIWLDLYIIFKTVLILLGRKPKVDY